MHFCLLISLKFTIYTSRTLTQSPNLDNVLISNLYLEKSHQLKDPDTIDDFKYDLIKNLLNGCSLSFSLSPSLSLSVLSLSVSIFAADYRITSTDFEIKKFLSLRNIDNILKIRKNHFTLYVVDILLKLSILRQFL